MNSTASVGIFPEQHAKTDRNWITVAGPFGLQHSIVFVHNDQLRAIARNKKIRAVMKGQTPYELLWTCPATSGFTLRCFIILYNFFTLK